MSVDPVLLNALMTSELNSCQYTLHINESVFPMVDVLITNSPIPVNEPMTRGGVYFSDKFAYKMKGAIQDLSVVPLLTEKMLGPNTEFGELKITTQINHDGANLNLELFTNLTNSVQTPNSIELSMIILKINSI